VCVRAYVRVCRRLPPNPPFLPTFSAQSCIFSPAPRLGWWRWRWRCCSFFSWRSPCHNFHHYPPSLVTAGRKEKQTALDELLGNGPLLQNSIEPAWAGVSMFERVVQKQPRPGLASPIAAKCEEKGKGRREGGVWLEVGMCCYPHAAWAA
jgi:hypothetical protein